MTGGTARLSEILAEHAAALARIDRRPTTRAGDPPSATTNRLLLPADRQRGCTPPIGPRGFVAARVAGSEQLA